MNARLEIIKIKEDVIATSSAYCDTHAIDDQSFKAFNDGLTIGCYTKYLINGMCATYKYQSDSITYPDGTSSNDESLSLVENQYYHSIGKGLKGLDGIDWIVCTNPEHHTNNPE